ncbi:hypothetical protein BD413DRAFT_550354 [Trametes elegans]|nr:hypothetical protein BD413DRAFT_550354 [Trametes elegans]
MHHACIADMNFCTTNHTTYPFLMSTPSQPMERVRDLPYAVFCSLEPGRSTLRLLDPATNELCDYQLVRISRPLLSPPYNPGGKNTSHSGDRPGSSSFGSGQPSDTWRDSSRRDAHSSGTAQGPQGFREGYYPLARLPPLSVRSRGDGTPSLLRDFCASDSSGSLSWQGPTPVRQLFPTTTTHNPDTPVASFRSGTTACLGLGFSGLFKDNGTPFDGLGSLPRRTSTPNPGWVSPTDERRRQDSERTAEFQPIPFVRDEDFAFPSHTRTRPGTPVIAQVRFASPPLAPARRTFLGGRTDSALPVRPEHDDVFLSRPRVPGSLTRGLFRRASSVGRGRGDARMRDEGASKRASVMGRLGEGRQSSLDGMVAERERDGERRPVWKP